MFFLQIGDQYFTGNGQNKKTAKVSAAEAAVQYIEDNPGCVPVNRTRNQDVPQVSQTQKIVSNSRKIFFLFNYSN